jgi:D-beta-D-heptose 7-phosphate kinase/D-beta-D-heptose 1-phosphate adenosyltransferase
MSNQIIKRGELKALAETLKRSGKTIVFTNGCFDLLHIGHVRYLKAAKALGDLLVVGLNSDGSVRQIKGPCRPVVPENERAEVLAALACVDVVTIFEEPDPLATIRTIVPDVLVKGADWAEDAIVGRDVVEATGGRVVRVPLTAGASTSRIIDTILAYGVGKRRNGWPHKKASFASTGSLEPKPFGRLSSQEIKDDGQDNTDDEAGSDGEVDP